MTTLITSKPIDGAPTRKCNAKCYNAKGPKCKCLCGGMNHGKGLNTALRCTSLNAEIRQSAQTAVHLLFPHIQYPLFVGAKHP